MLTLFAPSLQGTLRFPNSRRPPGPPAGSPPSPTPPGGRWNPPAPITSPPGAPPGGRLSLWPSSTPSRPPPSAKPPTKKAPLPRRGFTQWARGRLGGTTRETDAPPKPSAAQSAGQGKLALHGPEEVLYQIAADLTPARSGTAWKGGHPIPPRSPPPGNRMAVPAGLHGKKSPRRCTRRPRRWSPEKPREGNEGTGGPWIAVEEAGEGGGGFGLGVLGPGLAVAGEGKEKEGFGGFA